MTTGALESSITELFEFVFFEGEGGVSADVPFAWPISIGGRRFAIDLAHYQWQLPDMVRQAIDFSAHPGEQSFDTGGVWLRSNGDWSLGAGQEYHDADGAEQRQFAESRGIDVWTKRQIKLLPATETLDTFGGDVVLRLLPHGNWLYILDGEGQSFERVANPQDASPTFEGITGMPSEAFVDMTSDGNLIYIATASAIYKTQPTSSTVAAVMPGAAATVVTNLIEYANGFLLVGVDNVLSSIDAAGALTTVTTHRVNDFEWQAIVGTPAGIYAGGQADDIAEIVHIGIDPDTGGLAVPVHAGELPRGERLESLAYYGTVVLIGTSKGFRIATIGGDTNASLDIGPLIATGSAVKAAFGDSQFVWFGWSNYDDDNTGIGRANLAEFRERSQPAYASDLMYAGSGVCTDVCRFNDHTYFAIAGVGIIREQHAGNVVAQGTIRLGKTEWGTFEPKTFIGLQLITRPLEGSVSGSITSDDDTVTGIGSLTKEGSTGIGELLGAGLGQLSTFFDIELTLNRSDDDDTASPIVRLVTARALVAPHSVQRWSLPIICKERVTVGADDDVEQSQDVHAIREYFLTLRRNGTPVLYQEGNSRHMVIVRDVAFPEGQVERWGSGRNGVQGVLVVTIDSCEA